MIIRLSLCGVAIGNIRIDLRKLPLFENDIGKQRFVPNFKFPKIRFENLEFFQLVSHP